MAESRESIIVSGSTVEELARSLNFIFQRLSDRMDKIEGVRGTATMLSDLNLSGNSLISVGNFDQNLGEDDTPTFGGLTIDGDVDITDDLTVTNLTASGAIDGDSVTVTDSNSTIIHEFS